MLVNVFPKHVADYHKYMKPIKNLDKSNLLICPMPGKLIKILVKENQIIEEGQSLCVVEAMKMENTLVAPKQCIIKKINYKEGDTLSVDQVIMDFHLNKNYKKEICMEKKDNLENWKKNAINELKTPNVDNIFINTPEGINIKAIIHFRRQ